MGEAKKEEWAQEIKNNVRGGSVDRISLQKKGEERYRSSQRLESGNRKTDFFEQLV